MSEKHLTRRIFLKNLAIAVPAGSVLLSTQVSAGELPHLDESDPLAQGLLYVHDASTVDTSNPLAARYQKGQTCSGCAQLQGEDGATWRPCNIFPGKLVNANGWCSVWAPKA